MKKITIILFVLLFIFSCTKKSELGGLTTLPVVTNTISQSQINQIQKTTDSINNELKVVKGQVVIVTTKIDSIYKKFDSLNNQISLYMNNLNNKFTSLNGQTSVQQSQTNQQINELVKTITTLQQDYINLLKEFILLKNNPIQITNGIELVPVDVRLKSSGKGVVKIPVVIINYLPTTDGIYLDRYRTLGSAIAWDDAHKYTLERARRKILTDKIIEKNAIEEGTKFRDYATNQMKQYVDIDVVAYINVSDVKLFKVGTRFIDTTTNDNDDKINNPVNWDWNNIDFNELLTRINLKNYVENMGVKEVWFTSFPREMGVNSYNVPESNMSPSISINTGDISNGGGSTNDLPRYNKTYVLYGCNGFRGVDTDLHNRGHQLEAQMTYFDNGASPKILWNTGFVPRDSANTVVFRPRLGNTHYCPNTNKSYDYWNRTNTVASDIMSWKPSGGTFVNVNANTWTNLRYSFENQITMTSPGPFATGNIDYSNDAQVKWLIFWWQSIPGYNNTITDNYLNTNMRMNNWWELFYNWDESVKNNKRLFETF
jgi:archaellum component FlaC